MTLSSSLDRLFLGTSKASSNFQFSNYREAEQQFTHLLETENLDSQIITQPELAGDFEAALSHALKFAYKEESEAADIDAAHLFLQRTLYRINRLNLFWYDDLQSYENERSIYLQWIRDRIESVWQAWELAQMDVAQLQQLDVNQALIERGEADLNPPITEHKRYLREQMTVEGYKHLLAIASLDGLVEASRMSRILGGASNEVQATLIRVLLEEYGNGRLNRKHSTFFAQMMAELGLRTEPEAYFDWVPWEVLACINHNFLLTECKRHFLRYNGGLTYFEIAGPSIYTDYMLAAERLNLSGTAMGYWELHIREDERHGAWMLQQVALPLVEQYPNDAWELLLGYDQEKWLGDRAGAAVVRAVKQAEQVS
ncbi:iron-containing redox enzyme family protein [Kovacikia minuta CCNUW1]|uniref:iron-containing redox enzyme family protein n=1 Tax=Kovacikia minuta TaxID=2931930 RepID=UPI001CCB2B27|nr:iron-containing redox enzyme family protein [Kovacikia minuta]UBF27552.1 iron-containing redox enzyme family protein [Kovacikia minuta CCNUW1]